MLQSRPKHLHIDGNTFYNMYSTLDLLQKITNNSHDILDLVSLNHDFWKKCRVVLTLCLCENEPLQDLSHDRGHAASFFPGPSLARHPYFWKVLAFLKFLANISRVHWIVFTCTISVKYLMIIPLMPHYRIADTVL